MSAFFWLVRGLLCANLVLLSFPVKADPQTIDHEAPPIRRFKDLSECDPLKFNENHETFTLVDARSKKDNEEHNNSLIRFSATRPVPSPAPSPLIRTVGQYKSTNHYRQTGTY